MSECCLDRQTGRYLLGHRYYDWSQGRFLTRDPIGYAGGINLYGYCQSSPVGRADPWGLQSIPTLTAFGFHGNTAGNQLATLYVRYDAEDVFQKWGVTQLEDPNLQYSKVVLDGGRCEPLDRLPRSDALAQERWFVENYPGPLNREPWAGRPSNWTITDEGSLAPSADSFQVPMSPSMQSAECQCQVDQAVDVAVTETTTEVAVEQSMEETIAERIFP